MIEPGNHPTLKEPPYAHAVSIWSEETRVLRYEYNGRPAIEMRIPGTAKVDRRVTSDGELCSDPLIQQLYVIVAEPVRVTVTFTLSPDAVNMRSSRAGREQAIIGQTGRPLIHGVNGLYDIAQDLLIDWHGADWNWIGDSLTANAARDLVGQLSVELGPSPWIVNLKFQYYRKHLGYAYHQPWKWRPKMDPVAGWCSWEAYRREIDEDKLAKAAKFIAAQFRPYGMKYLQLDDGYQPPVIPSAPNKNLADDWLSTNERFPSGHTGIVKIAREYGLEAGIWIYTYVHNEEYAKVNPGFLKLPSGEPLKGEWIGFVVDCLPETLERYIRPSFAGYRKLGYAYLKTDGLRHLIYDGLHEAVRCGLMTNDDAENRFRNYVECIRDALGEDIFYLSSWGVLSQMVGVADACRIATDVSPMWGKMRMQMVETARWFHTQRILFLNDPDHLCVRSKLEWSRSAVSLTTLSGGLFMLSDKPEEYDAVRIDLVKKCLPPLRTFAGETGPLETDFSAFTWTKAHGAAFAAARDGTAAVEMTDEQRIVGAGRYPTIDDNHPFSTLWAFHLQATARRWCVAGRFATTPLRKSDLPMEALGLDPCRIYLAFDFWAQQFLGCVKGTVECRALELGHCQIIGLRPLAGHPQFLSSSRHISMDAIGVKDERWADGRLTLDLSGVAGTTETYWIHAPHGFVLCKCALDGRTVAYKREGDAIEVEVPFAKTDLTLIATFDSVEVPSEPLIGKDRRHADSSHFGRNRPKAGLQTP